MDLRDIKEFLIDFAKYALVVVFVIVLFVFVVGLQQVVGSSMDPTLKEGDIVIVDKLTKRFKAFERNDIVVLSQDEKYMIKRIIGLPGEVVEYKDNNLIIDGTSYKESFLNDDVLTNDFSLKDLDYDVIPDDMYLVLGDNRTNSLDSRNYGLIRKEDIVGKAAIRLWPFNKIAFLK